MSVPVRGRSTRHKSNKLILVVDGPSEKVYFDYFVGLNPHLKVIVKPITNQSSYEKTLDYCNKLLSNKTIELLKGDRFAVVADVDGASLDEVQHFENKCLKRDIALYVSNPCFEVWLVQHYKEVTKWYSPSELNQELTRLIKRPYVKSEGIPMDDQRIQMAIDNGFSSIPSEDTCNSDCVSCGKSASTLHFLVEMMISFR